MTKAEYEEKGLRVLEKLGPRKDWILLRGSNRDLSTRWSCDKYLSRQWSINIYIYTYIFQQSVNQWYGKKSVNTWRAEEIFWRYFLNLICGFFLSWSCDCFASSPSIRNWKSSFPSKTGVVSFQISCFFLLFVRYFHVKIEWFNRTGKYSPKH